MILAFAVFKQPFYVVVIEPRNAAHVKRFHLKRIAGTRSRFRPESRTHQFIERLPERDPVLAAELQSAFLHVFIQRYGRSDAPDA